MHELSVEDWKKVIDIDLTGQFICAKAVNGHILYVDGGILAYIGKQP